MNPDRIIIDLEQNANIFQSIFSPHSGNDEFVYWKSHQDKWSLLEILCHLIDEEKEDFRTRVKYALENSTGQPPSIDPQGWVKTRSYIEQNYELKCQEFLDERNQSITWLKSLSDIDWSAFFIHPEFGKFTAHYMLANWLAHDYLHFRQITKLRYDFLAQPSDENLKYAGAWR